LTEDDRLDLDGVGPLLAHLARSGCDGVVVGGTTGEGLALSAKERAALMAEALQARPAGLRVIAGTGSSALPNVIALTRRAFELGAEGVLIMPPLHVRSPSVMGLLGWYRRIIAESVPPGGRVLLYHIPQVSGVRSPTRSCAACRPPSRIACWA
jgi:4-hydroxy-tetrahydrodipicolinate synthase